jgi:hypothetical protein
MKSILFIFSLFVSSFLFAQNTDEFVKGTITLADGTVLEGTIKDNTQKKASVQFVDATGKKKTYDGWALQSVKIGTAEYRCVLGDFYTVLCEGEVSLLQKHSKANSKLTSNGAEPVLINPTEGKAGSYYLYQASAGNISLVNKESYETVVRSMLGSYEPAAAKALETRNDIAGLKTAVNLFNSRNSK